MEMPESETAYATLEPTTPPRSRTLKVLVAAFAVAAVVGCAVGFTVMQSHHSTQAHNTQPHHDAKLSLSASNTLTATQEAELLAIRDFDKCKPLLAEAEAAIRANATTTTANTVWTASDTATPPPGVRVILEPRDPNSSRGYRRWRLDEVRDAIVICGDLRVFGDELSYFPSLTVLTGSLNSFVWDGSYVSGRWTGPSRIPSWWAWLIGTPDPHRWFPRLTAATNINWYVETEEPIDGFPELETVGSLLIETGYRSIAFQKLKHVKDRLRLDLFRDCDVVGLPELTSAGVIKFEDTPRYVNHAAFEVHWPKLTHVVEFHLANHPNVRVIDLPVLERMNKLAIVNTGAETLDLPAATTIDHLIVKSNHALKTLQFDKLGALSQRVFITNNKKMHYLSPHLDSLVRGNYRCEFGRRNGSLYVKCT